MRAWLRNALELVLWFWIGRPTTKMEQRHAENEAKVPPHPKPGRTIL